MQVLLRLSGWIDGLNQRLGRFTIWLVLLVTLVAAINASIRFAFNYSSNAFLEIQSYLFAAIFLLCAPYTLMRNEHVRIDVLASKLSPRGLALIDIIGTLFMFFPAVILVFWLSIPLVVESYRIGEMSANAGGLIRWPFKLLLPLGFLLLTLQGVSELIKRIAFLRGLIDDPSTKYLSPSHEEQLASAIAGSSKSLPPSKT